MGFSRRCAFDSWNKASNVLLVVKSHLSDALYEGLGRRIIEAGTITMSETAVMESKETRSKYSPGDPLGLVARG